MCTHRHTVIDLFCGSGGFSLGFQWAGFDNVFSVEINPEICQTYRLNFPRHHLIESDIALLSNERIAELTEGRSIDVVIGGPPCQGFSLAGNIGRKFIDDPRNNLFREFVRVVSVVRPRCFVMENVARLFTHKNGETRAEIIRSFTELGYKVEARVVLASDYGVPQERRRVLFVGRLTDNFLEPVVFPRKRTGRKPTVEDAIGHFPPLASGERSDSVPNHEAMTHSPQMLEKMRYVGDGGTRNDIPLPLRPAKGDARKYIRFDSKKPAVCITGDMRKVFHYSQNRALTVRELAAIQTYPDDFVFLGSRSLQQQMVGNSVPPVLAKAIAEAVKEMLES